MLERFYSIVFAVVLCTTHLFVDGQSCSGVTQMCQQNCANAHTNSKNNTCATGMSWCQCVFPNDTSNMNNMNNMNNNMSGLNGTGDAYCKAQTALCSSQVCSGGKKVVSNDCDPFSLFSLCQCDGTPPLDTTQQCHQNLTWDCYGRKCLGKTNVRAFCDNNNQPVCDCDGNHEDKNATNQTTTTRRSPAERSMPFSIVILGVASLFLVFY